MWNLYIVPAIRHIMKNRGFTLINVTGLSFGPAACLLIFSFITHEMSCDGFLPDIGRLYRVEGTYNYPGREAVPVGNFFGASRDMLLKDYAEIDAVTRTFISKP